MARAKRPAQTPFPPTRFSRRRLSATTASSPETMDATHEERQAARILTDDLNKLPTNTEITGEDVLNADEGPSTPKTVMSTETTSSEIDALERERIEAEEELARMNERLKERLRVIEERQQLAIKKQQEDEERLRKEAEEKARKEEEERQKKREEEERLRKMQEEKLQKKLEEKKKAAEKVKQMEENRKKMEENRKMMEENRKKGEGSGKRKEKSTMDGEKEREISLEEIEDEKIRKAEEDRKRKCKYKKKVKSKKEAVDLMAAAQRDSISQTLCL